MATDVESGIICLANGYLTAKGPDDGKDWCSAVLYFEKENLATFSPMKVHSEPPLHKGMSDKGSTYPWEGKVEDITFDSQPELLFQISILPSVKDATSVKKDERVGGAAYVKHDPTNSTPKVFHLYPGKQFDDPEILLPFVEYGEFSYLCVYYGTRVDQTVPALIEEAKKIPEVVAWKHYASLGEEVARLEKENRDLIGAANTSQAKIASLEKEKEKLIGEAKAFKDRIDSLEKEKEKLIGEANASKVEIESLKKEINRLKALAKAVVDAIEGLKTYDKSETSTDDKNGHPDTDKDETSTTDGGKSSAA